VGPVRISMATARLFSQKDGWLKRRVHICEFPLTASRIRRLHPHSVLIEAAMKHCSCAHDAVAEVLRYRHPFPAPGNPRMQR